MDPLARKKTLRMFSNGVYIMTSCNENEYGGATVTWVSQASFKPPLVMAAVRKDSNVFRCLVKSGLAAIHVLSADQKDVAQRFFAPTRKIDGRLNGELYEPGRTSVPVLKSAPAYIECQVRHIFDEIGDHAVVIFEVVEAVCNQPVQALTVAESPWQYGG
jgi:flavin reductase (DIM6/NTAB) family NADH-FMN oxidoreductase RutF